MTHPTQIARGRNTLQLAAAFGVTVLIGTVIAAHAAPPKGAMTPPSAAPASTQTGFTDNTPLTEEQKIVHVLNRVGFGPRPGDVERIESMGLDRYIDEQLHPERIDDSAVDAKLATLPMLDDSNTDLMAAYADGLKSGQELRKIQGEIDERMKTQPDTAAAADPSMAPMADAPPAGLPPAFAVEYRNATPEEREQIRQILGSRDKQGRRQGVQMAVRVLSLQKAVRAAESNRQLYEVMCDFWSNHFNIDMRKGPCRVLKVSDERDVIRKYALGKFRDLLGASAHSPAMLFYLDNSDNKAPLPPNPRRDRLRELLLTRAAQDPNNPNAPLAQAALNNKRGSGGVNENYGREIMELHTLGVDGGYSQKDVQEVARCFTGWTIGNQRQGTPGEFYFDARRHDEGEKVVLGQTIPAGGGEQDGERVLDILASHPSTMRFVSTELCKRLVSDDPPPSLIEKCVRTWWRTDGDIREIVSTIVHSPEFNSRLAYRQKIKSPFEYAISSVRAVGGTFDLSARAVQNARYAVGKNGGNALTVAQNRTIVGQVSTMGQPLFQYQAPTGWPEDSKRWVSTGALISRLNFALGLTRCDLLDVQFPELPIGAGSDAASIVNSVTKEILNGDVSPATRATLLRQATLDPDSDSPAAGQTLEKRLTALVLGSPEFQRR